MRVFVVGGGGREHALVWTLLRSRRVAEVICAPGNPGIAELAECNPTNPEDISAIASLCERTSPDLIVVGPEAPLVAGLADALDEKYRVFGPRSTGARLEGSKSFAKQLMAKKKIPTAISVEFEHAGEALRYVEEHAGPVVIKADGLAAGKGVAICEDLTSAKLAIEQTMVDKRFGRAGDRILIEEKLEGPEMSLLAFVDGKSVLPMTPAQDYKRIFDGDGGPNSGGMGSYSPVPIATEAILDEALDRILEPVAEGLQEAGENYVGVIYAGLILTTDGLKVIEFNCRFGDPETQAVLPRLNSDLAEVMLACVEGCLPSIKLNWDPRPCVCVVAASEGYPGSQMPLGLPITGLEQVAALDSVSVFHSGTEIKNGSLVTSGGRVLSVSAMGADLDQARGLAYQALDHVSFEGMQYRRDIASLGATTPG